MTKKIRIETACIVNGVHADIGDEVETDVETASLLIRHRRASEATAEAEAEAEAEVEAPAGSEPAKTPAPKK